MRVVLAPVISIISKTVLLHKMGLVKEIGLVDRPEKFNVRLYHRRHGSQLICSYSGRMLVLSVKS
jgi:hypothetical protein